MVTNVIEQSLTGVDDILCFNSTTKPAGRVTITPVFTPGTHPNVAAVQTQRQVAIAEARLPSEAVQQVISIAEAKPYILMMIGPRSSNPAIGRKRSNDVLAS